MTDEETCLICGANIGPSFDGPWHEAEEMCALVRPALPAYEMSPKVANDLRIFVAKWAPSEDDRTVAFFADLTRLVLGITEEPIEALRRVREALG